MNGKVMQLSKEQVFEAMVVTALLRFVESPKAIEATRDKMNSIRNEIMAMEENEESEKEFEQTVIDRVNAFVDDVLASKKLFEEQGE